MKKRMKVLVAALLALSCVFALFGCGGTKSDTKTGAQPAKAEADTVTDAYGRTVELPTEVNTAATVGSGSRFVVYAGGVDKLIAVTDMETEASPARPYTVVYKDFFSTLPSTSNGNHLMETTVDTEALVTLAPDVIISSRSAEECDQLQAKTGIPVVGISYQNQLFSDDVYTSIEVVGEALGTKDHADKTVAELKAYAADLDKRTASIDDADRPSVYVGAVNYKGAKSFGGTYVGYAPLEAVHTKGVADELGTAGSVDVDLEQIGVWNPTYMFLNAGNMDLMKADYADNPGFFDNLSAFQSGNLYSQPSFNYNGTNVDMGICDAYFIGSVIYPDAFADLDMATQYNKVFETLLGSSYYDTMKSNGMDFKKISIAG